MVTVGCDRGHVARRPRACAARSPGVHATVGLHPHEARTASTRSSTCSTRCRRAGSSPSGECGLDYHYDHSPRDAQRTAFAAQIAHRQRARLPLVIHTREAWDDTFDVLATEGVPERVGLPLLHRRARRGGAGAGDRRLPQLLRDRHVQGRRRRAGRGRRSARSTALLVETDSPYLAPVPHRGRTNQPAWVPAVGARLAEIHGVTADRIRFSTAEAARRAFPGLPPA